jgi:secreted trypsin-like serine protease
VLVVRGVLLGLLLAMAGAAPAGAVVDGAPAGTGDFPWVVRLSVGCDGALVAPRVVLTAAHCVAGTRRLSVTAGSTDLVSGLTVPATSVLRPSGYRGATRGSDWALIRLDRALDLPTLALTPSNAYDQGTFTIMGWGAASEGGGQRRYLQTATVPFVADGACAAAYRRAGFVASDMLCAGRGGADTCQGDSGGPMVRPDAAGNWVEVGIVSWGYGCGRAGYPGVYTQVSTFSQAIGAAVAALR